MSTGPLKYTQECNLRKDLTEILVGLEQQINHRIFLTNVLIIILILSNPNIVLRSRIASFIQTCLLWPKRKVKTITSVLSKIFRKLRIPVSSIFDKKYPWIKRTFPNI